MVPLRIHPLQPPGFTCRDGGGPYTYTLEPLQTAFAANGLPLPVDFEQTSAPQIKKFIVDFRGKALADGGFNRSMQHTQDFDYKRGGFGTSSAVHFVGAGVLN